MITQKPAQLGVSLMEVLISLILISFMLLAFDSMQLGVLQAIKKLYLAKTINVEKEAIFARNQAKNQGFMLIEFLIALTVSCLLIVFLLQIYLSSQKVFQLESDLQKIINDADTLQYIFKSELRQAGNFGCFKLNGNKLIGDGNNGIIINHASSNSNELINDMQDEIHITVNSKPNFQVGDLLIISNCNYAEFFRVESVNGQEIISTAPLQHRYEKFSQISQYESNHLYYSVADKTLILEDIHQRKTILLNGLQQFSLNYTIKQDDQFKDVQGDSVVEWNKVLGVAIDAEFVSSHINQVWHFYMAVNV